MGCGISTKLDLEDATRSRRRMIVRPITDINSPASKNLDHGGNDSVRRSRKSVSSQGKDMKQVGDPGEKEHGEKEEEGYHNQILFVPGSPSFKDYCIASSDSRDQSFSDNFNDTDSAYTYSTKNGGDEDSAKGCANNKPEESKECKKKGRRGLGFRNVIHRRMPRKKRNLLNFGCYTSHASYDDIALNKVVGKTA